MLLTREDHAAISAAITAAEQTTAGEIYCIIAHRAASYHLTPLISGLLAALAVPALLASGLACHLPLHWVVGSQPSMLLLNVSVAQLGLFIVIATLTSWAPLRFYLTPKASQRAHAHALALNQFMARGLHLTDERTGVLIFVSIAERYAEIIADAGIHRHIEQKAWQTIVDALTQAIKKQQAREGFITAIQTCGHLLARHFPPVSHQPNQLPDRIIEI